MNSPTDRLLSLSPRPFDVWSPLLASRKFIFLLASVGLVVGALVASLVPPRYEAVARVLVSRPRLQDGVDAGTNVASFRSVLQSRALAERVVRELVDSQGLTASTIVRRTRVEEIRGTDLIEVGVRLSNPAAAADVTNKLVAAGVALTERLSQDQALKVRDYVESQLKLARERLDALQKRTVEFQRGAQVELVKRDVEALLTQRERLLKLGLDIQAEAAALERLDGELAKRSRVDTLVRSIDSSPALLESARQVSPAGAGVLGLQLEDQQISGTYSAIDAEAAKSRARLAGLRRENDELLGRLRMDEAQPALPALYQKEMTLKRLELELEVARKSYSDTASQFDQANLRIVGNRPVLQVVDPARPPDARVSPQRSVYAALGLLLGVVAGIGLAFVRYPRSLAALRAESG